MNRQRFNSPASRQQGAALVVSLIFLVILTMLGISVASNNTLQERMAGNTRQHDLSFQQAEAALKEADAAVNDPTNALRIYMDAHIAAIKAGTAPPTAPDGVRTDKMNEGNDSTYWQDDAKWTDANSYSHNTSGGQDRRYIVDYMGSATDGSPAVTKYYFRVTARGASGNAEAILQSMYKFE